MKRAFSIHLFSVVITSLVLLSCQTTGNRQDKHSQSVITISLPNMPQETKSLEMVLIKAGSFQMGCPSDERSYIGREWPPHQVTITQGFYLGKYEVTQAQWFAVMGTNPAKGYGVGDNYPVYNVSWNDCMAFIQKLNGMKKGVFRMPTEAEWEYACRAGTTTRYWFGDALDCNDAREYGEFFDQYMWWGGNNGKHGYPMGCKEIGLKIPNPWGLYDISGNLWEFCSDWWRKGKLRGPQTDPRGPTIDQRKVMRGGAWESHALHHRSADRSLALPGDSGRLIGLRLVRLY
jgi:formylglycine-generating enzyme required for sulfatase activity